MAWLTRSRGDITPLFRPSDPDFELRDRLSPFKTADDALTHAAGVMCYTLFPDHPWKVWADHSQGCVFITIPALMGATNYGVIHISDLANEDVLRKCCSKVCGEILERYRLPRARFSRDEFLRAWHEQPLHLRGYHGHVPG